MAFDPAQYLAEKKALASAPAPASSGFDPAKYLAEKKALAEGPSTLEAGLRGAAKGATLGFEPAIAGAGSALVEAAQHPVETAKDLVRPGTVDDVEAKVREFAAGGRDPREVEALRQTLIARKAEQAAPGYVAPMAREVGAYRQTRDSESTANDAAEAAHPVVFTGAEIAGGVAPTLIPGLAPAKGFAGAMKTGAALGALSGLGNSKADLTKGEIGQAAADTLVGGGAGAVAGALGEGVSKATEAIAPKLGTLGEKLGSNKPTKELIKALYDRFKGDLKGAGTAIGAGALSFAKGDEEEGADRLTHAAKTAGGVYLASTPEGRALLAKAALPAAKKLAEAIPGTVRAIVPSVQRAFSGQESSAVQQQMIKLSPAERLQHAATHNPASLGKYGAILNNALQKGGQKDYDAAVFVLGQTDPSYQALTQKLAEDSGHGD